MRIIVSALVLAALGCPAMGQFSREWQSGNTGYNTWGASYGYDVSNDGVPNLWVRSPNQVVIYNPNYTPYWTISFSGYDYPYLVTPRDIDGDGLIKPVNMDADPSGEVVATAYRVSGQDIYGRMRVYDASSRQLEWDSGEIHGFAGSASVDDVDGDGRHEIIITRYNYSGNWGYVDVYGYSGAGIDGTPGLGLKSSHVTAAPSVASGSVGFRLAVQGRARLAVYDEAGREVAELVNAELPQGEYRMEWDGRNRAGEMLPAGAYLYRLEVDGRSESGRIVLVR